jgi:serine/threonine protein kinase
MNDRSSPDPVPSPEPKTLPDSRPSSNVSDFAEHATEEWRALLSEHPAVPTGPVEAAEVPFALPGYDILDEIGQGGMGVVYRARQRGLKRIVALKMIRDQASAHPHALARFRTEAQALASLQHPNIVQIYEVGEHDGQPFFSLEYVKGGSLDDRLAGTPQPPRNPGPRRGRAAFPRREPARPGGQGAAAAGPRGAAARQRDARLLPGPGPLPGQPR